MSRFSEILFLLVGNQWAEHEWYRRLVGGDWECWEGRFQMHTHQMWVRKEKSSEVQEWIQEFNAVLVREESY